jgi:hypothetical protein
MDLMFDAQLVLGEPEVALEEITRYYRHVTGASPVMAGLISVVMLVAVIGAVLQARASTASLLRRIATPALVILPVALALAVVFPAAHGLGEVTVDERLGVARTILWAHVTCFVSVGIFTALQLRLLGTARVSGSRASGGQIDRTAEHNVE